MGLSEQTVPEIWLGIGKSGFLLVHDHNFVDFDYLPCESKVGNFQSFRYGMNHVPSNG